jgi:hypothetical protein
MARRGAQSGESRVVQQLSSSGRPQRCTGGKLAAISAERPAQFWSIPPCTSVPGHQLKSGMTDTLEKRLIEALQSVERTVMLRPFTFTTR